MNSYDSEKATFVLQRQISKAQIQNMPLNEQALFLAVANAANEINALLRLAVWSDGINYSTQAQVDGQRTLLLMFLKLLAGKLLEANQLIHTSYFGSAISREYNPRLDSGTKQALDYIKHYFDGANTLAHIRNNFAFHYSPDELANALPSVTENLVLYMRKDDITNDLFYFAEIVSIEALCQFLNKPNNQSTINDLSKEIIIVAKNFSVLFDGLLGVFVETLGKDAWQNEAQQVLLDPLPAFDDIHIPWFTNTSSLRIPQNQSDTST